MSKFDEEEYKKQLLKKLQPSIKIVNDNLETIEKSAKLSQLDAMKKARVAKRLIEPHIENVKRISQELGSIDTTEFKAEIHKNLYGNGWCILMVQPLELVYGIVSYESEQSQKSELYSKLKEAFDETNNTIEEKLKIILGDADSIFIENQFILMRLNYRINSIPSIIMFIEKMIIKITGKQGKFVSTGKVPKLLRDYIEEITSTETGETENTKYMYIQGFKNNLDIIDKTFIHYDDNKEAVHSMNILNRNQIFHGLIDFDSIDEIHYYKLYFILIFLTEVYEYEQVD